MINLTPQEQRMYNLIVDDFEDDTLFWQAAATYPIGVTITALFVYKIVTGYDIRIEILSHLVYSALQERFNSDD